MKNSSFISWSSYGRHFYRSIYISIIFEISSKELLFVCTKIIITFNIFDLFKLNYLIIQKMLFYSTNYKLWIPFRYVLISFITEYYGRKLCNVGVELHEHVLHYLRCTDTFSNESSYVDLQKKEKVFVFLLIFKTGVWYCLKKWLMV